MPQSIEPPTSILIVGSGCFGASTALSLVRGSYASHPQLITVLDRSCSPPEIDAASSDINKIIRQDYADPLYASLALQAIEKWRGDELYRPNFAECGVLVAAKKGTRNEQYVRKSLELNQSEQMRLEGKKAWEITRPQQWKKVFGQLETASDDEIESNVAYFNQAGGWADSRQAVVDVVSVLRSSGVTFIHGEAASLIHDSSNSTITGIVTKDGRSLTADLTILASGAWTSALLPELRNELIATGQVIGTIQLTEEEAEVYRDAPVSLFLDTGFYAFPPSRTNLIKFAIHSAGYINPTSTLPSTPRTTLTPGYESQQIPSSSRAELLSQLGRCYPSLVSRDWCGTRLCWYTDRSSGDWLIDYHPGKKGLFVASGGSGHAFKFFPILGDLVVKGLERRFEGDERRVWSWKGMPGRQDKSREGRETRKVLDEEAERPGKAKL